MKKTLSYLAIAIIGVGMLGIGASAFAQSANVSANIQLPGSNGGVQMGGQARGGFGGTRMPSGNMQRPGVIGTVTSVSGNIITVTTRNNATDTIDATSAKISKGFGSNATTISVSAIAVGDHVAAQGTLSGTNVVATSVIDLGTSSMGSGNYSANPDRVTGKVSAVSGDTVTVVGRNNTTYSVDATNATVTNGFGTSATASSVGAIVVGDYVSVTSSSAISGTSVTATAISNLGTAPSHFMMNSSTHLVGTVSAVNGSIVTITNQVPATSSAAATTTTVTLDTTSSTTVTDNGQASAFANIAVGQTIVANGTLDSATNTFTATSISIGVPKNAKGLPAHGAQAHRGFFQGIGGFFKKIF